MKCDRREPCASCSKARVPCIFRAPAPRKRGKKKRTAEELHNVRLKRYHEALKPDVAREEESGDESEQSKSDRKIVSSSQFSQRGYGREDLGVRVPDAGKLIVSGGRSRYVEK